MKPETILRAYREALRRSEEGWQGPVRRKLARQRNRFLLWLCAWADCTVSYATDIAPIERKGGR
jgi:hypothetical protein